MIEVLTGAAVGMVTIASARLIRGERWLYAVGLLTLPFFYAAFALWANQHAASVQELLYGIPFIAVGFFFACVSVRHSAAVIGIFWLLHGLYDLLHVRLIINDGVPGWYPVWCCAVDVVVGSYLLWLSRRVPEGNLRLM